MKQKSIFVLSLLFGLIFINAGMNKFFEYMPVPDDLPESMATLMDSFLEITWLIPLVGFVEVVGGILFIFPKTRALGAVVIFPIIIGILLVNIFNSPSGLPFVLILLSINLWVIFENRVKYLPMIKA